MMAVHPLCTSIARTFPGPVGWSWLPSRSLSHLGLLKSCHLDHHHEVRLSTLH